MGLGDIKSTRNASWVISLVKKTLTVFRGERSLLLVDSKVPLIFSEGNPVVGLGIESVARSPILKEIPDLSGLNRLLALHTSIQLLVLGRLVLELSLLFCGEIALMIVLSLQSPIHFNFPSIITDICGPRKLIGQPLVTHILLDTIDNLDDLIDVFLKLFADL